MHPSAYRNSAGIWVDPSDPSFTNEATLPASVDDPSLPIIYLFSNARNGDGIAYAMAEDGTVLGSHWCSHWGYMRHDLHDRADRKAACEAHYPGGYQIVVLGAGEVPPDAVLELNAAQRTAAGGSDE